VVAVSSAADRQETVGSNKFKKLGRTAKQQAADLDVPLVLVQQWREGYRKPNDKRRTKIAGYSAQITDGRVVVNSEDWDTVLVGRRVAMSAAPSRVDAVARTTSQDVADEAGRFIATARALREELEKQSGDEFGPSLAERAKILSQCATMIDKAGRQTGASADISEAKILKSPAWAKLMARVVEALRPYPEAARAVGEALKS
jgi:hypothetical protein